MNKPRKIKMEISPSYQYPDGRVEIGGWIQGKDTYLWIGLNDRMVGIVERAALRKWATLIYRAMPKPRKRAAAQEPE